MAINVMIVDDSIFIRVLLKDILEHTKEREIKVVASVSNGLEAIKELKSNPNIDVITLDIRMPEKDGIETLKEIMKIKTVPVIMLSSLTKNGAKQTIEALNYGAIDFITKANDEEANSIYSIQDVIRKKVITVANSNMRSYEQPINNIKIEVGSPTYIKQLIVVGSSTGGPGALRVLLSDIPKEVSAPIVIAQHMPEGAFSESLAEKLNESSNYKVKVIENGEEILPRTAYICPGGFNVELFKRGVKVHMVLTQKAYNDSVYKPSVDMLFTSCSRLNSINQKIGIVLTGMGDDGSKGSLALYRSGGTIITESQKTAVIYGMPKKANELLITNVVADVDKIFKHVVKTLKGK